MHKNCGEKKIAIHNVMNLDANGYMGIGSWVYL